jgi:hypothetical protein
MHIDFHVLYRLTRNKCKGSRLPMLHPHGDANTTPQTREITACHDMYAHTVFPDDMIMVPTSSCANNATYNTGASNPPSSFPSTETQPFNTH